MQCFYRYESILLTFHSFKFINKKFHRMASYSSKLNANDLYKDLQSAIEQDKLHWIRNDAKIRACVTSKNYDEFREIVAAAHLQPLTKNDKERKQRSWNTLTDGE